MIPFLKIAVIATLVIFVNSVNIKLASRRGYLASVVEDGELETEFEASEENSKLNFVDHMRTRSIFNKKAIFTDLIDFGEIP